MVAVEEKNNCDHSRGIRLYHVSSAVHLPHNILYHFELGDTSV